MNEKLAFGKTKHIGNFWHLRKTRAAQVAFTVCCFALPILCLPLALRDNGSNLWVRVALPRTNVKRIVAAAGAIPLKYALTSDSGAFRSTDDGITWQPANNGLPRDGWGRVVLETLVVAEDVPSIAYAGVGLMDRGYTALNTGLYMTEDAAATWLAVGSDMAGKEVQAIAVMPPRISGNGQAVQNETSAAGSSGARVVYVATNAGILRSLDGGRSWSRLAWRGLEGRVLCLAIHPRDANVIFIGTEGAGLYGTWDGGMTWKEMNQGLGNLDINHIAFGSLDPSVMYVATNDGVFKSWNAGAAWTRLQGPVSGRRITVITLHPQYTNLIYAGLEHGAAYVSTDGGEHWTALRKGLGQMSVFSLAIDPRSPESLWAGTADGVWRYIPELPVQPASTPIVHLTSPAPTENKDTSKTAQPTDTVTTTPSPGAAVEHAASASATLAPLATRTPPPSAARTLNPTATRTKPAPSRTLTRVPALPVAPPVTEATAKPPSPPRPATATAPPR